MVAMERATKAAVPDSAPVYNDDEAACRPTTLDHDCRVHLNSSDLGSLA